MKVLVYSSRTYDQQALLSHNADRHELFFTDKKLTMETVPLAAGFRAVALFTSDDASAEVLKKLAELRVEFVALRSVGYDHVNVVEAEKLGIQVANVPEYSPYAVAEHAVALLMAATRKIVQSQKLADLQDYRLDSLVGFDLHGKTVGVVGTGNIGLAFCKILTGFGARVIASDPVINEDAFALGVRYVSFEALLRESDVISIHCPLNAQTKYLFSEKTFSLMKDGATLVNTSRGGIVNTKALIAALKNGKLRAACLDVYEKEKGLFFNDRSGGVIDDDDFHVLRSFKNVLITGHQGFLTNEALTGIAQTTLQNVDCWEGGVDSPNALTKLKSIA